MEPINFPQYIWRPCKVTDEDIAELEAIDEACKSVPGYIVEPSLLELKRVTEKLCVSIESPDSPRLVSGERKPALQISKRCLAPDGVWESKESVVIYPEEIPAIINLLEQYVRRFLTA